MYMKITKFRKLLHLTLSFSELDDLTVKQMLIRDLEESRKQLQELSDKCKEDYEISEEHKEELKKNVNIMKKIEIENAAKMEEMTNILESERKKSRLLQKEVEAANVSKNKFEIDFKLKNKENISLLEDKAEWVNKAEAFRDQIAELDKNLSVSNTEKRYLEEEIDKLQQNNSKLEIKLEEDRATHQAYIDSKSDLNQKLEKQNIGLLNKIEKFEIEIFELNNKINNLLKEKELFKVENEKFRVENTELQDNQKRHITEYTKIKRDLSISNKD